MTKYLLVPDSFKGTMSSMDVINIMDKAIRRYDKDAHIHSIPVADGGEGSVDAFLDALGGERIVVTVKGPYNQDISSFYGLVDEEKTAVVEMAAAAGLPLVEHDKNPLKTSTYGVGELIVHALDLGVDKIILALGGSATNDGGCGMACALGVRFLNSLGEEFIPVGGTLKDISKIDLSGLDERLQNIEVTTMCDIDNPLYGPNGAAYIFGPQKGATSTTLPILDDGLRHLAKIVTNDLDLDYAEVPGSGAAGGMGFGSMVFMKAKLQMGIEAVLDAVDFNHLLNQADYVFTGEGQFDDQSLRGKVVIGVARRAKKKNVPVIALVGQIRGSLGEAYDLGVTSMFSINTKAEDFSVSRFSSKENLEIVMENIIKLLVR